MTEQPPYSLLVRGIDADVLPVAEQFGMGVLPWWLLARRSRSRLGDTFMDDERLSTVGDTRCTVLLDHSSLTEKGLAGATSGIAVT
jgi:aryl-alcohol dehydrogenase-like predicted oxidoreductase